MDTLTNLLHNVSQFDHFALFINLLIFLFSRKIIHTLSPTKDEKAIKNRLTILRSLNLILFFIYCGSVGVQYIFQSSEHAAHIFTLISESGLTLLVAYILGHILKFNAIRKYGKQKEIDGETTIYETYQSELFGLLGYLLVTISAILVIINIWSMTSLLEVTSLFGGLAIILFSTKDVWAPDNINGLILLYNSNVEPGDVVKIDEYNLVAIAIRTTLTQTVLRDLSLKHQIVIPNSRFRNTKIEILSNSLCDGVMQYVDYKIGYGTESMAVERFLEQVWKQAVESDVGLNEEKAPRIRIIENGDHAVTWRMFYVVRKIYKLYEAEFTINRIAYDLSLKDDKVKLNTPLTHVSLNTETTNAEAPGPDGLHNPLPPQES